MSVYDDWKSSQQTNNNSFSVYDNWKSQQIKKQEKQNKSAQTIPPLKFTDPIKEAALSATMKSPGARESFEKWNPTGLTPERSVSNLEKAAVFTGTILSKAEEMAGGKKNKEMLGIPTVLNPERKRVDEQIFQSFSPGVQTTANVLGTVGGLALPTKAAYGTLGKGAVAGLSRLAPNAGKLLAEGVRGAAAGAGVGAYEGYQSGDSLGEIGKKAGYGALGGAILDPAFMKAGQIAKPLVNKIFFRPITSVEEMASEAIPYTPTPRSSDFVVDQFGNARPAFIKGELPPAKPVGLLPRARVETDFTAGPLGDVQKGRGVAGLLPEPNITKSRKLSLHPNNLRQAQAEFDEATQTIQNYLQHYDVLARSKPGTTMEQAIAEAERATGVDWRGALARLQQEEINAGKTLTGELGGKKVGMGPAVRNAGLEINKPGNIPRREIGQIDYRLGKPGVKPEPAPPLELPPLQFKKRIAANKPLESPLSPPKGQADINPLTQAAKAATNGTGPIDVSKAKDIGGFTAYSRDPHRNFLEIFGPEYGKVKKDLLDPLDVSKKTNVEFQEIWLEKLKTEVVDKLGVKKGSKESALVQDFGEGRITEAALRAKYPKIADKVIEADKWFRKSYDELIETVNAVRKQIYPNNPDKIIPKRKDYYRHFREFTELTGLKNIFDTPANIDPKLVGISEFTLPKSKWLSFAQKRKGGEFKSDAVGGFLDYIPSSSYATHIDPHIGKFEKLADYLAESTGETKHLNTAIEYIRDFARDLSGKTNYLDRVIIKYVPGGRKTIRFLDWANSRIKANTVLGNASSALAQLANVPQGVAYTKQYSVRGAGKTLATIFIPSKAMAQSGFLKERFGGFGSAMYRQFDSRLIDQPKKLAIWLMETADRLGTNFIWNSVYSKGVAEKVANPIKYADDITRKLVAGRGIGEVPLLQKSRVFQMFFPFTLEMANAWRVMKDFAKAKDVTGLAVLFVANHLFNKGLEKTRGSGAVFDPVQAMVDAFAEEDLSPLERGGRMVGEVLSNIPGGNLAANIYPEYGTEAFGRELPTRKQLFGNNDPTRFGGTGLPGVLSKGVTDPLFNLIPPFGGKQVQKTIRGREALQKGGVYSTDKTKLKYPVDTSTPNQIRGLLFGPSALPETKDYYDKNRRPLSEKQTLLVEGSADKKATFEAVQKKRVYETTIEKINKIKKDTKLSDEEKRREIEKLLKKLK